MKIGNPSIRPTVNGGNDAKPNRTTKNHHSEDHRRLGRKYPPLAKTVDLFGQLGPPGEFADKTPLQRNQSAAFGTALARTWVPESVVGNLSSMAASRLPSQNASGRSPARIMGESDRLLCSRHEERSRSQDRRRTGRGISHSPYFYRFQCRSSHRPERRQVSSSGGMEFRDVAPRFYSC